MQTILQIWLIITVIGIGIIIFTHKEDKNESNT
jgi:hypothetical protein